MFSSTGKQILLALHLILVSAWFGSLITILILHLIRATDYQSADFYLIDRMIFIIFDKLIMNISIGVALSGLIFSMFTKWGFFKFYWITVKWIAISILAILLMFGASPVTNGMAAISDILRTKCSGNPDYIYYSKQMLNYTLIQILVLIAIIYLSVTKPWGARKQRFTVKRKILLSLGSLIGLLLLLSGIMQYQQLTFFRNLPVTEANLENIPDGDYQANVDYGFDYQVMVKVQNHVIIDIAILKNRNSIYAQLAELVRQRILDEQRVDVAAVTGATTTSKVLIKAVEVALKDKNRE